MIGLLYHLVWGPILQEIKEDEDFMDSEELVEKVEKNLEEELPDLNDIEMEKVKVGPKKCQKIENMEFGGGSSRNSFLFFLGEGRGAIRGDDELWNAFRF